MSLRVELQRFGRAYPRTQTAVNAAIFINHNLPIHQRHFNIVIPHPVNRFVKLIDIARKLYQQLADLIRGHVSPKNIRRHVEVFGEPVRNRHVNRALRKSERQSFFHAGSLEFSIGVLKVSRLFYRLGFSNFEPKRPKIKWAGR